MSFFSKQFEPRPAEISAAQAELAIEPFVPPNMDITVVYGGHSNASDFAVLQPHLEGADVFVPEITYWGVQEIALLSRISQGDKSAQKELERDCAGGRFSPFDVAEINWLRGSEVYVTAIDYSIGAPRADEMFDHYSNWGLLDKVDPSYPKTLDRIATFADREADIEGHREAIMIQSLGPRLETLVNTAPELAAQEPVQVVIHQGLAHTFFFHELDAIAAEQPTTTVKRVFAQDLPIVFEHFDRLTRAARAGIELDRAEKRELASRALARVGLGFDAIPLVVEDEDYQNGRLVLPPAEEMVDRFSEQAIKDFHHRVAFPER